MQLKAVARFAALRPPRCGDGESSWALNLSRHAPDELGMALSVSRRAAGQRIALAYELTARLPLTWAALHAGRIDVGKARVIADRTGVLEDQQAHAVEQRVLARAEHQTHPELKAATDRAAITVDPKAAVKRRKEQVEQREVRLRPLGDGVSELAARLPAEVAAASYDRLCELAAKTKTPDDSRTPNHQDKARPAHGPNYQNNANRVRHRTRLRKTDPTSHRSHRNRTTIHRHSESANAKSGCPAG